MLQSSTRLLAALIAITTGCESHDPAGIFEGTLMETKQAYVGGELHEAGGTHEGARVEVRRRGEVLHVAMTGGCAFDATETGKPPSMHPIEGARCSCRIADRTYEVNLGPDSFAQVTRDSIDVDLKATDLGEGVEGFCTWSFQGNRLEER
jgi:hypothetical protein